MGEQIRSLKQTPPSAQVHNLGRTTTPQITTHKKASQLRGFFI